MSEVAQGISTSPKERLLALLDEHLPAVVENILDERTSPKKPRAVILTVELSPRYETERIEGTLIEHSDREDIGVVVKAASRLCPIEVEGPRLRVVAGQLDFFR